MQEQYLVNYRPIKFYIIYTIICVFPSESRPSVGSGRLKQTSSPPDPDAGPPPPAADAVCQDLMPEGRSSS